MKIKIIILGILLITVSYLTASCNKNEIMKMVNAGFFKSEINTICNNSDDKMNEWITLSKSQCKKYGGKIDRYDVCKANLKTAKKICYKVGGILPTLDELKSAIVDCGGIVESYDHNLDKPSYQSCYRKKGFSNLNYYWSSKSKSSSHAWVVNFESGITESGNKSKPDSVSCINREE